MTQEEVLEARSIAVSVSNSPDLPFLGLSHAHLQDAMAEIARHLLALGARLCYGGDLRSGGFSELLFELVERHKRDSEDDTTPAVSSFLAWPLHISMPASALDSAVKDLLGVSELIFLDTDGSRISFAERRRMRRRQPTEKQWKEGLTSMRRVIQDLTHARIVLGGQVDGYKGLMPGVAEEALMCLDAGSPLYLVGGFGGCARDIAETLGLVEPWTTRRRAWHWREQFERFIGVGLNNGLCVEENKTLAKTPHIDQAIVLLLRGLTRVDN